VATPVLKFFDRSDGKCVDNFIPYHGASVDHLPDQKTEDQILTTYCSLCILKKIADKADKLVVCMVLPWFSSEFQRMYLSYDADYTIESA